MISSLRMFWQLSAAYSNIYSAALSLCTAEAGSFKDNLYAYSLIAAIASVKASLCIVAFLLPLIYCSPFLIPIPADIPIIEIYNLPQPTPISPFLFPTQSPSSAISHSEGKINDLSACHPSLINKIIMHHQGSPAEIPKYFKQDDKNASALIETLKEKEASLRREQIISSLLEEVPKSFPKLLGKDILLRQATQQERDRSMSKLAAQGTLEGRSKHNQKSFFKALEEEHRNINRENMQMLGLTIQKISYSQKNKKGSCGEFISEQTTFGLTPELLNIQNTENMHYNDSFIGKKLQFTVGVGKNRVKSSKRPQSIRVRDQTSPKVDKRRRSVKPINNEYSNPIYDARIFSYRELLFRLNWSYNNFSDMEQPEEVGTSRHQRLKAWIGGGNNSPLVRQLIKRRYWWQVVEQKSLDVNFVWTQLKVNDFFKKQTPAPIYFLQEKRKHTEPISKELTKQTAKDSSRRIKPKKEEKSKDDEFLYKIMPEFQRLEFLCMMKSVRGKQLWQRQQILKLNQQSNQHQKMHNHLTNNFYLGNKKALFYNLKQYYELIGGNLFKVIPLTFHIKKGAKDPQYKRFIGYHKKRQAIIRKQEKDKENGMSIGRPMRNIWIVKPGELTNRGNGITVIDQPYELDAIMKSEGKHENGTEKTFIVQLYIDRPFLYKKRKFDIRHYMMISQLNGVFKAYWYKEGYIRTASYQFDVFNFQREIHLTNDAVQKFTPLYGRFQPANKISYAQFQKYLYSNYPKDNLNFQEMILPRMKAICLDAVKSSFVKLSPQRFKHNFQIFGLDFMIDSEFNPWLIEINTNPCLELACPLLSRIIPQMVDQALRLTLDVIYPPPCHYPNTAKHLVPDASLESLRFQLIFDERVDGAELRALYKKCKNNLLDDIGNISDDEVYQDCGPNNLQLEEIL